LGLTEAFGGVEESGFGATGLPGAPAEADQDLVGEAHGGEGAGGTGDGELLESSDLEALAGEGRGGHDRGEGLFGGAVAFGAGEAQDGGVDGAVLDQDGADVGLAREMLGGVEDAGSEAGLVGGGRREGLVVALDLLEMDERGAADLDGVEEGLEVVGGLSSAAALTHESGEAFEAFSRGLVEGRGGERAEALQVGVGLFEGADFEVQFRQGAEGLDVLRIERQDGRVLGDGVEAVGGEKVGLPGPAAEPGQGQVDLQVAGELVGGAFEEVQGPCEVADLAVDGGEGDDISGLGAHVNALLEGAGALAEVRPVGLVVEGAEVLVVGEGGAGLLQGGQGTLAGALGEIEAGQVKIGLRRRRLAQAFLGARRSPALRDAPKQHAVYPPAAVGSRNA
jgi:hypothetical protein